MGLRMALVALTMTGSGLSADKGALQAALDRTPPGAPIVAMIHGYRYIPGHPRHDPHRQILSIRPDLGGARTISWPRHLGLHRHGLGLAIGWDAAGGLHGAHRRAADTGAALAALADRLAEHGRPLDLIAHSLGARVALAALSAAQPGAIGRVILLAAADLASTGGAAMHSPAGRRAEVINITGRENRLFDLMFERLIRAGGDRALGRGLPDAPPNWLDLPLDCPDTRAGLARLGHRVAAPALPVCHWSGYLRPGAFPLYRALLTDRDRLTLPRLRACLPGPAQDPLPALVSAA